MKQQRRKWMSVVLAALLLAVPAAAEEFEWRGSGGWGAGFPYHRLYDTGKEQTVRGEVTGLVKTLPLPGMAEGLAVLVRYHGETVEAHLGPIWYLERQDFPLAKGDQVEIVGTTLVLEGKPALMVREIRKTDKALLLRDPGGFPLWSAWRRL